MSDKLNPPEKNCPIHGTRMLRTGLNYTCAECITPPAPPVNHVRPATPQPLKSQDTRTDFRRWVNDVSDALGIRPPSPLV